MGETDRRARSNSKTEFSCPPGYGSMHGHPGLRQGSASHLAVAPVSCKHVTVEPEPSTRAVLCDGLVESVEPGSRLKLVRKRRTGVGAPEIQTVAHMRTWHKTTVTLEVSYAADQPADTSAQSCRNLRRQVPLWPHYLAQSWHHRSRLRLQRWALRPRVHMYPSHRDGINRPRAGSNPA